MRRNRGLGRQPRPHAPTAVGGWSESYDGNGNLWQETQSPNTWAYKHDAEGRLVKLSLNGGTVARYAYDGDGKRVKRLDSGGTVPYVGGHYERNLGTGTTTAESVSKQYWAQLGPLRRLMAVRKAGALTYLYHDHLGSTKAFSGTPYRYYPYGVTYAEPAGPPTDTLYTGQKRDGSGLYYYGARYYNPYRGLFLQPDSIVPDWRNPQSLNRYAYGLGNPLGYTDPTGHFPIPIVLAAAASGWLLAAGAAGLAVTAYQIGVSLSALDLTGGVAASGGWGDPVFPGLREDRDIAKFNRGLREQEPGKTPMFPKDPGWKAAVIAVSALAVYGISLATKQGKPIQEYFPDKSMPRSSSADPPDSSKYDEGSSTVYDSPVYTRRSEPEIWGPDRRQGRDASGIYPTAPATNPTRLHTIMDLMPTLEPSTLDPGRSDDNRTPNLTDYM